MTMVGMIDSSSSETRRGFLSTHSESMMEFEKKEYQDVNAGESHETKQSNPFDVLYEPHKVHSPSHYNSPLNHSFRYLEMEHNGSNSMHGDRVVKHMDGTGGSNFVTVIDSSNNVYRTDSMSSRSATLRNRNRIKSRNKMVRKNDLPDKLHPTKDKKKSKFSFMFPVRRERSLKQKPKYVSLNRSPRFTNIEEFQQLFDKSNAANLLVEMMSPIMNHFKYKKLFLPDPKLITSQECFQITRTNSFILNPKPRFSKLAISLPIKESFTKNGIPEFEKGLENSDFVTEAYNRYRTNILTNKLNTVPSFHQFFPEEASVSMISAPEVAIINRNFLFEVLLRRTIAAKIDYRLRNNGYFDRKSKQSSSGKGNSGTGSSTYSSSSVHERFDNLNLPDLSNFDTNSSSNGESIDTVELLKQNVSLYSGVLSSSHSTGIELDYLIPPCLNKSSLRILQNFIEKKSISSSSVYSTPKTNKFPNSGKFTPTTYINSPELLYINTFRQNTATDGLGPIGSRGSQVNSNPRITNTTDITGSDSMNPQSESGLNNLTLLDNSSNYTLKSKRKSQTSSNNSILQNLEDLSSDLSSYANGHQEVSASSLYTPQVEMLEVPLKPLNKISHNDLIQSIEDSNESVGLNSAHPNRLITSESPTADIESMRASISIVGTLSNSGSNSSSTNKASLHDAIVAHNLNTIEAKISPVALEPIKSAKRNPRIGAYNASSITNI